MSSRAPDVFRIHSPGRSARHDVLARIPIFMNLGDAEIDALAERAIEKQYQAGDRLFLEGDPARGLYLLGEGSVKIYKTSPSGREVMLAMIVAPSSVAEVTLFDGDPYPASAMTTEAMKVLFIDARDFQQVCRAHPEVPLEALRVVGRRLRQLVATVERISFGSIRQRLATQLLEFGKDHFTLPMTHQEMASRLGTVREVVTRNLGRFQAEGFIQVSGREIRILDRGALQSEAETEL